MVQGPGPHAGDPGHGPEAHEHAHDHHGFAAAASAIGKSERARRVRTVLRAAVFALALGTLAAELWLRSTGARARARSRAAGGEEGAPAGPRWAALGAAGLLEELADPVRRYGLRPGADVAVDGLRFRVSSRRTRGAEVPAVKPGGERRLVCLGDSFAFGLWCGEQETFAARLAALATAREAELASGRTWRALELGVPGYQLVQSVRAFEQDGLALEPDLVVLYCNTGDIEQTGYVLDEELGLLARDHLPLPVALKRRLWDASHLYGWIVARHARAVEHGPAPYLEPRVPWAPVRADNQAAARAALAHLSGLCAERALPLLVVHQPRLAPRDEARRADWPVLPLVEWFRATCDELGLPALILLGWLRGYADNVDRTAAGAAPDFLPDATFAAEPGALSGAGYAHLARLAHERLRAEGLLP